MNLISYPGGKFYLASKIIELFPQHKCYVEVFGGGAHVLFQKNQSAIEVYNDIDKNLYALFKIMSNPKLYKEFVRKISKLIIMRDIFNEFKIKIENDLSLIDRAVIFYYLSRNSMFGGQSSFGVNKAKHRPFYRGLDFYKIAHERLKNVVIENKSYENLIEIYDSQDTLFYLDPPYVLDTRNGELYRHEFNDEKHLHLIEILQNIKGKAIVSGYDSALYFGLSKWNKIKYSQIIQIGRNTLSQNLNNLYREETLWYNYEIEDLFSSI